MPEFLVTEDGWVAGRFRAAGERVTLTEAEAKYERVAPAEAVGAAALAALLGDPPAGPADAAALRGRTFTVDHAAEAAAARARRVRGRRS